MESVGAIVFLYAETPLHAGSGTGLGAVDLPIQRERMSNLPMIQGSGIKGAWRELLHPEHARSPFTDKEGEEGKKGEDTYLALFGPYKPGDKTDAQAKPASKDSNGYRPDEFAGALSLADAALLLFPVRTVWGGWAWITCPMVLQRLSRDLEVLGVPKKELDAVCALAMSKDGHALVSTGSSVSRKDALIIEDIQYEAQPKEELTAFATWLSGKAIPATDGYKPFADRLAGQLAVLTDAEFQYWTQHATEVVARTSISRKTGTVEPGALWSEESLPAESMLWCKAYFAESRHPRHREQRVPASALQKAFCDAVAKIPRIRLGGDRNIGRGVAGVRVEKGVSQ